MVTIRSPFCRYNTIKCVKLNGENLSCYSNKIESISFRKCPHDRWLTGKTCLSAITISHIYQSFYLQDGGKNQLHRYGTKLRHRHPMYRRDEAGTLRPASLLCTFMSMAASARDRRGWFISRSRTSTKPCANHTGNENVPKIIINNTIDLLPRDVMHPRY